MYVAPYHRSTAIKWSQQRLFQISRTLRGLPQVHLRPRAQPWYLRQQGDRWSRAVPEDRNLTSSTDFFSFLVPLRVHQLPGVWSHKLGTMFVRRTAFALARRTPGRALAKRPLSLSMVRCTFTFFLCSHSEQRLGSIVM
jgi:hypothetical protein